MGGVCRRQATRNTDVGLSTTPRSVNECWLTFFLGFETSTSPVGRERGKEEVRDSTDGLVSGTHMHTDI